ncbi:MAG: hypothetical protein F6K16_02885 [Symploca sp. SIO2B6]|nr:hypothetical protein [Symploca sp. SIO2B6]
MGRWGDGERGRRGDGEMGRLENSQCSPLLNETVEFHDFWFHCVSPIIDILNIEHRLFTNLKKKS